MDFHFLLTCIFLQEQKQQEKLAFERHLEEKHREHAQLLLMNNSRKENILNSVRQVHCIVLCWSCILMYLMLELYLNVSYVSFVLKDVYIKLVDISVSTFTQPKIS